MKILAIQNRMGIGDTVIFLPYIRAISNKFGVPVSLLVKENSKANEFLNQTNYIDEIIHLERDNKINLLLEVARENHAACHATAWHHHGRPIR